eukprot:s365_g11.t1
MRPVAGLVDMKEVLAAARCCGSCWTLESGYFKGLGIPHFRVPSLVGVTSLIHPRLRERPTQPGLVYYQHESGQTQFERPSTRSSKDPLAASLEVEKRRRVEAEKLPERAVKKGEARVWHILKKHRDFFGKPAKSWRQKEITWSKKEAKAALKALKFKLENVAYGGGAQALQKKFENYARAESDDDISAKVGGDLGPITKKKKLFGGYEIANISFEMKIGTISDIVESRCTPGWALRMRCLLGRSAADLGPGFPQNDPRTGVPLELPTQTASAASFKWITPRKISAAHAPPGRTGGVGQVMLLRLLLAGLALLGVVYFLKGFLLQLTDEGAESGSPDAGNLTDLELAQRAFRTGNDEKAYSLLSNCLAEESKAPMDLAMCKTALGELYLVGSTPTPRNLTKAKELFEEAASVGESDAQYNLAILYANTPVDNDELRRNEALAVLYLYAASTAGHPGALMAMGYRHLHGYGVPQACTTAALNYIDVAKGVASIYSSGMPQAVELVRLNLPQKDRKVLSSSELNLFVQIATSGDSTVAAAIGKRYLLGIEGFKQDFSKAKQYLQLAATHKQNAGALALLGYIYCLGLGTPVNLDTAYAYFVTAASSNDPLGHNGLGYIYFRGTNAQARNLKLAFKHFNESAYGGSSDGMFNLASMYLTGTAVQESFQKAVLYYTQALDRGHTPAAYSLAVMHLNGIGTVRDCDIAVNLLKKVCERGEWVSSKLVSAYDFGDKNPNKAALMFLKLAEAGHEVSQMNVAHLFDSGQANLFSPDEGEKPPAKADDYFWEEDSRSYGRNIAQRFYELSAEQGSASSELRLGDYAYYGWGRSAGFTPQEGNSDGPVQVEQGEDWADFPLPSIYTSDKVLLTPQNVDYEAALARYRKTADMTVTGEWMQSFDLNLAKQHFFRCREVDPSGLHAPVTLALTLLACHLRYLRLPTPDEFKERLLADLRSHVLLLHLAGLLILVLLQCYLSRRRQAGAVRPATLPAPDSTAREAEPPSVAATSTATWFDERQQFKGPS